eukprot:TRINITY_DN2854_c0_g1_i2.p1 TRINITY_DN2854_c0_g1~~TRINITY_DN2854_c0_g1_i2.p1  ORF type:complete len:327 (-),score=23.53 TRINITY_DN2854_c0_g1_i2:170-1150(-)
MGKDKFGTKRGKCGMCDECYEYTPPQDGISLACEYCDHKPIYHAEVITLGTCSCGKCHGYTSNNECQYTSCDYCDCSADKHIGYDKVQNELDKAKQRLNSAVAPVVKPQETTPTPQPQVSTAVKNGSSYGLQGFQGQTAQSREMQPMLANHQPPMTTGQYGAMPSQGGMLYQGSVPYQGGGMPSQGMPSQGGRSYQGGMPSQGIPYQGMPSQGMPYQGMPSQGMPSQGGRSSQGGMSSQGSMPSQGMPYQGMPSQGMPYQGMPSQGMPYQGMSSQGMPYQGGMSSQGGMPSGGDNKCVKPGCNRQKRQKEDGSGVYDYCGKFCAKS